MKKLFEQYVTMPYFIVEGVFNKLSDFSKTIFAAALSVLFAAIYFSNVLLSPSEYIFAIHGDDLKNYYTLKTYIDQPVNKDILHYNSMNYPYHDIVYYSDNTPLLSMPLKWLSMHGAPSINPIPAFNYFIILNYILASILCYLLLSRIISSNSISIILSVSLPYFNPQSIRIMEGTENLALCSILVANFLLLYIIYQGNEQGKSTWQYQLLNYLLIVCSSFIHLYYLIILCLNTGLTLFAYFLLQAKRKTGYWRILTTAVLVPLLGFLTTFIIYLVTDEFYSLRNETAMGYNFGPWKTHIAGLFTSYQHMNIRFLIETTDYIPLEAHTYLGSFMLYGLVVMALVWAIKRVRLSNLKIYFDKPAGAFILLLLLASVASLLIAVGPDYLILRDEYRIHNFLDLFSFFQLFTHRVEHFRCIGRFSWFFFWSANFCFAYLLDNWLATKNTIAVMLVYVLCFLAIKDLTATGEEYRRNEFPNQFLLKNIPGPVRQFQADIMKTDFDAILPLPFFLVGSEVHDETMDPTSFEHIEFCLRLASSVKLPIMSSMSSRTPLSSNHSLFNFFRTANPDSVLKSKLTGKKIAVLINNDQYKVNSGMPVLDNAGLWNAFYNAQKLPQLLQMTRVDSSAGYILYEWQP